MKRGYLFTALLFTVFMFPFIGNVSNADALGNYECGNPDRKTHVNCLRAKLDSTPFGLTVPKGKRGLGKYGCGTKKRRKHVNCLRSLLDQHGAFLAKGATGQVPPMGQPGMNPGMPPMGNPGMNPGMSPNSPEFVACNRINPEGYGTGLSRAVGGKDHATYVKAMKKQRDCFMSAQEPLNANAAFLGCTKINPEGYGTGLSRAVGGKDHATYVKAMKKQRDCFMSAAGL